MISHCDFVPGALHLGVMKVEMSLDHYDRFLQLCDASSSVCEILRNGVIARLTKDDHYERIVKISCETRDVQLLLALADQICPAAVPEIQKSIDSSREL